MSEVEIEIDGKLLKAAPNSMVIQVADAAGIYIPRFCYHKELTVAANCRMCLVEVEKAPKPMPACATPVMPGMKVFTRSPKAIAAQKAVMEFLLINHPLDCPICDQGGECELQDLSMGYGQSISKFTEGKRSVHDKEIGSLIQTEMTRCIHCTRCVRFGTEIAGMRELGVTGRGEHSEIGTYLDHAMESEISGNVIDLCPVGALTSKPFRFTARAWELNQYPSIAAHDCLGSNINVHTRNGRVMRVVPREHEDINQMWLSDRDRFSYTGLYHADRLAKPLVRSKNGWKETDWQNALETATKKLQQVIEQYGADQVGVLASPNSTLEELYLLQKLARQLGIPHIDHRLRQTDMRDQSIMPLFPGMSGPISQLEHADVIVLIGSNIQKEQPLAAVRIRKAIKNGAKLIVLNMHEAHFNLNSHQKHIVAPQYFSTLISDVALQSEKYHDLHATLKTGKNIKIIVGAEAFNHPDAAVIRSRAMKLAQTYSTYPMYLTEGANAAGAWMAGAIPHRGPRGAKVSAEGLNANDMWLQPRKAYLLLNVEPDLDCANPIAAKAALESADCVISLSMFHHRVLAQFGTVMLPTSAFTETSGTFVNQSGEWQRFKGVVQPFEEARPAWKVLRVLANLLHLEGFDYESSDEVLNEFSELDEEIFSPVIMQLEPMRSEKNAIYRIGDIPIYATDSLVRRAQALQEIQSAVEGDLIAVRLHPKTAETLQLRDMDIATVRQGIHNTRLPVVIDENIPEHAAYIPGGLMAMGELSELFGAIDIEMRRA